MDTCVREHLHKMVVYVKKTSVSLRKYFVAQVSRCASVLLRKCIATEIKVITKRMANTDKHRTENDNITNVPAIVKCKSLDISH